MTSYQVVSVLAHLVELHGLATFPTAEHLSVTHPADPPTGNCGSLPLSASLAPEDTEIQNRKQGFQEVYIV